ncbi:MAG TPA: acetoacetate--CoA ligase [Steroidobacteraceae bacterium]|jgi:acetoacetyl-CoA synthetase|nr:acetoacetate--CoA ligase [Steroidobacteraceae bacterium]
MVRQGELLWTPTPERIARARITDFRRWLQAERGLEFATYEELWKWSVTDIDAFWQACWDFFGIEATQPATAVLGQRTMPGAEWFPGATLNYARHMLRHERPDATAILHLNERSPLTAISGEELGGKVRVIATQLRKLGLKRGDRLVAYMPNIPEALVMMLATTSVGAIWSSCGPDFGTPGVLDRFSQLEPTMLLHVDGYQYGGKPFDRREEVKKILARLTTVTTVIYLPYLDRSIREPLSDKNTVFWNDLLDHPPVSRDEFRYEEVPFGHPLWILFTSGTTGLPKPIMHSHGGILIEQLKHLAFNFDLRAGERIFFFTTTGWMMWNFLVSSMLSNVIPVLYDGNPAWPDGDVLWKMVQDSRANLFGASPTYQAILQKAGLVPRDKFDLTSLDSVTLAGSPVTPECQAWFHDNVKREAWVAPGSGGTDICSGFVGGVVILPQYAGEIQARCLGNSVYALNEAGEKVVNEVGEMVITQPMPSMPVGFWNDKNHERLRETYFSDYPGIWRQGDFFLINERGGCFVLGRSDATLNRHGVRIGTAEIYRAVSGVDGIEDGLIVNLDLPGGRFFMPLFVKLTAGTQLDEALRDKVRDKLRREYSPRHVPDKIYAVPDIPYTLTGKRMEVPVRRILSGVALAKAANRDAMANPKALDYFIDYARDQQDYSL